GQPAARQARRARGHRDRRPVGLPDPGALMGARPAPGHGLARGLRRGLRRLPYPVRLRLTLVQSGLIVASGTALLALTYLLVAGSPPGRYTTAGTAGRAGSATGGVSAVRDAGSAQARQHTADLHQLLVAAALALLVMAVLSFGLGWLAAGRILRPLRAM